MHAHWLKTYYCIKSKCYILCRSNARIVFHNIYGLLTIFFYYYNRIRILYNRIEEAWAQIDVQLKKRFDLVPNLVETVKGYQIHEQELLTEITEARSRWQAAGTPQAQVAAANQMESALGRLLVVVENYPNLKANENFKLYCLIYDRDPKEIQPGILGPDKDWMIYREFYCPGCGTQVEVEPTPVGTAILHSLEVDI